jgi:hypothetical protein
MTIQDGYLFKIGNFSNPQQQYINPNLSPQQKFNNTYPQLLPKFKASPIIKAAPFPSLVGEGQGGVRGEVYKRGFIFGSTMKRLQYITRLANEKIPSVHCANVS